MKTAKTEAHDCGTCGYPARFPGIHPDAVCNRRGIGRCHEWEPIKPGSKLPNINPRLRSALNQGAQLLQFNAESLHAHILVRNMSAASAELEKMQELISNMRVILQEAQK